jgi:hypothetical protein
VTTTIYRPLGLSELLAETIRLYGHRFGAAIGLGLPIGGVFLATLVTPSVVDIVIVAAAFTASYAAAARVAAGDSLAEAWAQVGLRAPTLLVLAVIVAVPFALAVTQLYLLIPAVAWLGLMGFAIPVAMLEQDPDAKTWFDRLGHTVSRSFALARSEYLHAVGVSAALVMLSIVLGIVLTTTLVGFADNGREIAAAIAQVILAPLFFLGLSVLYFEQKVRAVSSRSDRTRRPDAEVPDVVDPE